MSNLDASEFIGTPSLIETKMKNATAGGTATSSTTFKITAPVTNPFKPKEPEISTTTTTTKTAKKK
jgi:hypothetical protein